MSYEKDVYFKPEASGLSIVGDVDFSDGCYQFDMTVVWQDEAGQFFYADDSGCSCPSPFDGVEPKDLTPCNLLELQAHLEQRVEESSESERDENRAAVVDLLGRIRERQVLAA